VVPPIPRPLFARIGRGIRRDHSGWGRYSEGSRRLWQTALPRPMHLATFAAWVQGRAQSVIGPPRTKCRKQGHQAEKSHPACWAPGFDWRRLRELSRALRWGTTCTLRSSKQAEQPHTDFPISRCNVSQDAFSSCLVSPWQLGRDDQVAESLQNVSVVCLPNQPLMTTRSFSLSLPQRVPDNK
jgi:hypothetical protein